MDKTWKELYFDLIQYKETHDSIQIRPTSTSMLNDEEREEFYQLFQLTREAYVLENFKNDMDLLDDLISCWNIDIEKLKIMLNLSCIRVPYHMQQLIDDPVKELALKIYNPFFEVVRGNKSLDDLDSLTLNLISNELCEFKTNLYKWWLTVRILVYLEPTYLYTSQNVPETFVNGIASSLRFEDIPPIVPTDMIDFKNYIDPHLLVSNLIVFSKKLNKYVAIGDHFMESVWIAKKKNFSNKWISIPDLRDLYGSIDNYPSLALYYSDELEPLEMYGDRFWLSQPDVIIDYVLDDDWDVENVIHSVKRHAIIMQPKCGTIVVSKSDFDNDKVDKVLSLREINWNLFEKSPSYQVSHLSASKNKNILADLPSMEDIEKPKTEYSISDEEVSELLKHEAELNNEEYVNKFENAKNAIGTEEYIAFKEQSADENCQDMVNQIADQNDDVITTDVKGNVFTHCYSVDEMPESNVLPELYDRETLMDCNYEGQIEPELNIKIIKVGDNSSTLEDTLQLINN